MPYMSMFSPQWRDNTRARQEIIDSLQDINGMDEGVVPIIIPVECSQLREEGNEVVLERQG